MCQQGGEALDLRRISQRSFACALTLVFMVSDVSVYAQGVIQLPPPGTRLALSPVFVPPVLKGVKVYRNDPFRFDFILDKGDAKATDEQVKIDSTRLIKYFLASLTVPEKDLWVNLSPYEKDRIVPEAFGQTEMGRDLLAQDYILKQITASVIYPDEKVGKEFWDKVYAEALKRYGTTDIPVDTFNKVWIVPQKATVYENKDAAFVVESRLKVMLETDYMATARADIKSAPTTQASDISSVGADLVSARDEIAKNVLREIIIPILEKEVNEGKNFATLRQVYNSLILATWYKRKVKAGIMGQAYVDKQKTGGIDIADKNEKEKIWSQYVEAFRRGAYNLIKEEVDPGTQTMIPRKYFSGGTDLAMEDKFEVKTVDPEGSLNVQRGELFVVSTKDEVLPPSWRETTRVVDALNIKTFPEIESSIGVELRSGHCVVSVSGISGVGKTTLIDALGKYLRGMGYNVATIKGDDFLKYKKATAGFLFKKVFVKIASLFPRISKERILKYIFQNFFDLDAVNEFEQQISKLTEQESILSFKTRGGTEQVSLGKGKKVVLVEQIYGRLLFGHFSNVNILLE